MNIHVLGGLVTSKKGRFQPKLVRFEGFEGNKDLLDFDKMFFLMKDLIQCVP